MLETHAVASFWGADQATDVVPEQERVADLVRSLRETFHWHAAEHLDVDVANAAELENEVESQRNHLVDILRHSAVIGKSCTIEQIQTFPNADLAEMRDSPQLWTETFLGCNGDPKLGAVHPRKNAGAVRRRRLGRRVLYDSPVHPRRWDAPPAVLRVNHYTCAPDGHKSTQHWCSPQIVDTGLMWSAPKVRAALGVGAVQVTFPQLAPARTEGADRDDAGCAVNEAAAAQAQHPGGDRCSAKAIALRIVRHTDEAEGLAIAEYLLQYAALHRSIVSDPAYALKRQFVLVYLKWDHEHDTGLGNRAKVRVRSELLLRSTMHSLALLSQELPLLALGSPRSPPPFTPVPPPPTPCRLDVHAHARGRTHAPHTHSFSQIR